MKKILLGSTAVAAAALIAGSASAQDVTSGGGLKITGWVGSQAVLTFNNDVSDDRDFDFVTGARIQFDWSSTTDSGLTYGARVRLEVDNSAGTVADAPGDNFLPWDDDFDATVTTNEDITVSNTNTYVFVSGSFGTVKMGDVGNASGEWYNYYVHDSKSLGGAFAIGAEDSYTVQATGVVNRVVYVDPFAGAGIYYVSPDFGGLQFALSYQPEAGNVGRSIDFATEPGDIENVIAGAVQYSTSFDGGSFFIGGSLLYGDSVEGTVFTIDPFPTLTTYDADYYITYGIGAGGEFGPFSVGVWWTGEDSDSDTDMETLWISGAYEFGAFTAVASATFGWGEDEALVERSGIYVGTLTYQIAPGLNAFGEIAYVEADYTDGSDDDGAALGAGLVFGF